MSHWQKLNYLLPPLISAFAHPPLTRAISLSLLSTCPISAAFNIYIITIFYIYFLIAREGSGFNFFFFSYNILVHLLLLKFGLYKKFINYYWLKISSIDKYN